MHSRYHLAGRFASGAQSEIWEALDLLTGEKCLLKTGTAIEREAFLARELNHPYIAAPYDFGRHPELGPYAAYHYLPHLSLFELTNRASPPADLQEIVLQIAEVLSFFHQRGWLYNDFKPEHFLFSDHQLHVLDLGLCTPFKLESKTSEKTFSGTFPYISPERLLGRPCDPRSDIFALGMMLLRLFFPEENWNADPSLPVLHQLRKRTSRLNGFWRTILTQMTAMERSQRIGSAAELWYKLLPSTGRRSFLFHPIPSSFLVDSIIKGDDPALFIQSPSNVALESAENEILLHCWRQLRSTFSVDLRHQSLSESIRALGRTFSGHDSFDFYSGLSYLQELKTDQRSALIFRYPEALSRRDASMLSFCLSSLAKSSAFRIVLIMKEGLSAVAETKHKLVQVGQLDQKQMDLLLSSILPSLPAAHPVLRNIRKEAFFLPEQVLGFLKERLPENAPLCWPVAARNLQASTPIEKLNMVQKKTITALALAGGNLTVPALRNALDRDEKEFFLLIRDLQDSGYARQLNGSILLTAPAEKVLKRARKKQLSILAPRLLAHLSYDKDPTALYYTARNSGNLRLAAHVAMRLGRNFLHTARSAEALSWFWNAFNSKARLPRPLLYRMTKYYLRQGRMEHARTILQHIRTRWGFSWKTADLLLESYLRVEHLEPGKKLAEACMKKAMTNGRRKAAAYFRIRLAGILILMHRFQEGESLLRDAMKESRDLQLHDHRGMIHHFLGLSYFYRGSLDDSLLEFKKAIKDKHPLRPVSLMNIGIVLGKKGLFETAEKCFAKSIRILSQQEDVNRLCNAYHNMGILLKLQGNLREAREHFHQTLRLSHAGGNVRVYVYAAESLAVSYEVEGRTSRAIEFHAKAAHVAERHAFRHLLATVLTNSGLQHAIRSQSRKALSLLQKSLEIRTQLGADLAGVYEYLGLTYYLSGHYTKAQSYFLSSLQLFEQGGAERDHTRTLIYLALTYWKNDERAKMKELLDRILKLDKPGIVEGLYNYALAAWHLDSDILDQDSCRIVLHEAERVFRELPALFWLGKLYMLKSRYLVKTDHHEKAGLILRHAYDIFKQLGARRELFHLGKVEGFAQMDQNFLELAAEKLPYKLLVLVRDIMSAPTTEEMINRILSKSLEFTDMERAVLILNEQPHRVFRSQSLEQQDIHDICEISLSAVQEATESAKPYISYDVSSNEDLKSRPSIIGNRIMSIVCLPLRTQEKVLGVLYLDSSEEIEFLAPGERVLLEIFASIVAMGLNNSLVLQRSIAENTELRSSFGLKQSFPEILARSSVMMEVFKNMERLLENDLPVLITGETGTGKELVARVIHYRSKRKNSPFVAINCSTLPKTLFESELFGHEKGAFTGALNLKLGLFEEARDGTLFLDEITEMPRSMQAKLLRVLQEGEFRRVGGNKILHTNARIVFATNLDLQEQVRRNKFREDLYYRIKRAHLHLPSLRERREDIPVLAAHFLKASSALAEKKVLGFRKEAIDAMKQYDWPGNVRELKNEIERVVAFTDESWIGPKELDPHLLSGSQPKRRSFDANTLKEIEKKVLLERLDECEWNIMKAARSLGLTRNGLYSKMKQFGIARSKKD